CTFPRPPLAKVESSPPRLVPCGEPTNRAHGLDQDSRHSVTKTRVFGTKCLRSEEHTSELQSRFDLVCRLLLEKKTETRLLTTSPRRGRARFSLFSSRYHSHLPSFPSRRSSDLCTFPRPPLAKVESSPPRLVPCGEPTNRAHGLDQDSRHSVTKTRVFGTKCL